MYTNHLLKKPTLPQLDYIYIYNNYFFINGNIPVTD